MIIARYFKCSREVAYSLNPPVGVDVAWEEQPDGSFIGKAVCTDNLSLLRDKLTLHAIEYPLDKDGKPDKTKLPIADRRPTEAGASLLAKLLSDPRLKLIPDPKIPDAPASLKNRKIQYMEGNTILDSEP